MTRPFKLTAPRVLESDRQRQIIDWLRFQQNSGKVVWFCRVNGGGVKTDRRFIRFYSLYMPMKDQASRGYPDIHGMLSGGRYFAMEVKQPGEKATPEQREFIKLVIEGGGIAGVVYGYEDAQKLLEATNG